ncbi:unnamed protein product [Symbiodinium natans]|uniref:Calmodulin n=1 Tax=Symbiodinium natans TaxID=878477 RepID=A0A812KB28_9DINO|nr:unnamed protein product [Symbiodinium natans]
MAEATVEDVLVAQGSSLPTLPARHLVKAGQGPVKLPSLQRSASESAVTAVKKLRPAVYGRRWASENKRFLHKRQQRRWLEQTARTRFVDFTAEERAEFQRYFDYLKGPNGLIGGEAIEDMLIALGVVNTQDEVSGLIDKIDDQKSRELDFEQFLELITVRNDSKTIRVFRDMLEGKLGDRNLNFQTVLSQYRRQRLLDGTGCMERCSPEQRELGCKVLKNFTELTRNRTRKRNPRDEVLELFGDEEEVEEAPLGGMKTLWRGLCTEHNLMPSRPTSGARALERPKSPTEILAPCHQITCNRFIERKEQ